MTTATPHNDRAAVAPDAKNDLTNSSDRVLASLDDNEKEVAARTSYRYFVASAGSGDGDGGSPPPTSSERDRCAKLMIDRFLAVEEKLHGSTAIEEREKAATTRIKKTIAYRVEHNVDEIRQCFEQGRGKDEGIYARHRQGISGRFSLGASYVRGYTKSDCAMFLNYPRCDSAANPMAWNEEFYMKGNIYMIEKALACTERRTKGEKYKCVVLYDYSGYSYNNAPPIYLARRLLYALRDHWPGHLESVFVVDSPFIFRAFWEVIKHFIDPVTSKMVQFVTGEEAKDLAFGNIVDESEAPPWVLSGGKRTEEVDMNNFFLDVPFDQAYGE